MIKALPLARLVGYRDFLLYLLYRFTVRTATLAQSVIIGWDVYDIARRDHDVFQSAFYVGLVGLCVFLPMMLLTPLAGDTADRYNRRKIMIVGNIGDCLVAGGLVAVSLLDLPSSFALPCLLALSGCVGSIRAFTMPAGTALMPALVPKNILPRAVAWSLLAGQTGMVLGPWLGGILTSLSVTLAYGAVCGLYLLATTILFMLRVDLSQVEPSKGSRLRMIVEGLSYVWSNKLVFGAISLDMFAVLLGGVTALLPVFARDILHLDAAGFGLLRSGAAIGAGLVTLALSIRPIQRYAGAWMLSAVAVYGVATILFALSRDMWFSFAMLTILGAADSVSVFVRQSLVQIMTPDAMRGRVASVSGLFINASNELGEFESGMVARILGPVGSALFGGIGALVIVVLWAGLFPKMRRADRIQ
ncbi:MAG: MFS transporter [Bdellovibrionales bacterium]